MMMFQAVLFLSVCAIAASQDGSTWSCDDADLTIGKRTVICIHAGNQLDWVNNAAQYLRFTFTPEVDQYSRFHVTGSFRDMVTSTRDQNFYKGNNITVAVASQQKISFLRQYYDAQNRLIYPHLTAIFDVGSGRVKGVTWDDASVFCGGRECNPVTYNYEGELQTKDQAGQPVCGCPIKEEDCLAGNTNCDLTISVVWTGGDSQGHGFQSSASRYSAFPAQDLGDRFTRNLPSPPDINILGRDNENGNTRDLL